MRRLILTFIHWLERKEAESHQLPRDEEGYEIHRGPAGELA